MHRLTEFGSWQIGWLENRCLGRVAGYKDKPDSLNAKLPRYRESAGRVIVYLDLFELS